MNNNEKIINYDNLLREASNGFGQIKDKVTLVNRDLIKKANINHFENNLPTIKEDIINQNNKAHNYELNNAEFEEYKFENKNTKNSNKISLINDDNQVFSASSHYSEQYNRYPKINNSNDNNHQDFDLTFKNGKNYISNLSNFLFNLILLIKKESKITQNDLKMSNDNEILYELEFFKNEKLKFEKRNLEVEKILNEKLNEFMSLNEKLRKNTEEFLKLNSKHNGLLLYASDLQKKLDNLEIELLEKNQKIFKFQSTEWGEMITRRDYKIDILQNDILYYKNELNRIKSVLGNEKVIDNDIPRRIDNLIDSYITENKKYKRIVIKKIYYFNF